MVANISSEVPLDAPERTPGGEARPSRANAVRGGNLAASFGEPFVFSAEKFVEISSEDSHDDNAENTVKSTPGETEENTEDSDQSFDYSSDPGGTEGTAEDSDEDTEKGHDGYNDVVEYWALEAIYANGDSKTKRVYPELRRDGYAGIEYLCATYDSNARKKIPLYSGLTLPAGTKSTVFGNEKELEKIHGEFDTCLPISSWNLHAVYANGARKQLYPDTNSDGPESIVCWTLSISDGRRLWRLYPENPSPPRATRAANQNVNKIAKGDATRSKNVLSTGHLPEGGHSRGTKTRDRSSNEYSPTVRGDGPASEADSAMEQNFGESAHVDGDRESSKCTGGKTERVRARCEIPSDGVPECHPPSKRKKISGTLAAQHTNSGINAGVPWRQPGLLESREQCLLDLAFAIRKPTKWTDCDICWKCKELHKKEQSHRGPTTVSNLVAVSSELCMEIIHQRLQQLFGKSTSWSPFSQSRDAWDYALIGNDAIGYLSIQYTRDDEFCVYFLGDQDASESALVFLDRLTSGPDHGPARPSELYTKINAVEDWRYAHSWTAAVADTCYLSGIWTTWNDRQIYTIPGQDGFDVAPPSCILPEGAKRLELRSSLEIWMVYDRLTTTFCKPAKSRKAPNADWTFAVCWREDVRLESLHQSRLFFESYADSSFGFLFQGTRNCSAFALKFLWSLFGNAWEPPRAALVTSGGL